MLENPAALASWLNAKMKRMRSHLFLSGWWGWFSDTTRAYYIISGISDLVELRHPTRMKRYPQKRETKYCIMN